MLVVVVVESWVVVVVVMVVRRRKLRGYNETVISGGDFITPEIFVS